MYKLLRKLLFLFDAETSHNLSLRALAVFHKVGILAWFIKPVNFKPIKVMGLEFPNRVGLAAGLDKNADYIDALAALGFGFIEVGTVTPKPQAGNVRPRLFRVVAKDAIINRFGFNNKGVDHLVEQVKKAKYQGIIGINIGKNATTTLDNALDDYLICLRKVYLVASYITINISSPNTKGLRKLQHGDLFEQLLQALKAEQGKLQVKYKRYVPMVLKLAPDVADAELINMAELLVKYKIDAVAISNTTLSRDKVENEAFANEQGGLSGAPLFALSTQKLKVLAKVIAGKLPIIGIGGIDSQLAAEQKLAAGADLLQIYSGLIYKGPCLIRECA